MELKSSVFQHLGLIPQRYTCDGEDVSPPLTWSDLPPNTKSLCLICDDPDAPMGTWDHWVIVNLPSELSHLPEGIQTFPEGTLLGRNSWGRSDYGGPCPPDREHRYYFTLYALDKDLDVSEGVSKQDVLTAMTGHILNQTVLMGRYNRPCNKA